MQNVQIYISTALFSEFMYQQILKSAVHRHFPYQGQNLTILQTESQQLPPSEHRYHRTYCLLSAALSGHLQAWEYINRGSLQQLPPVEVNSTILAPQPKITTAVINCTEVQHGFLKPRKFMSVLCSV